MTDEQKVILTSILNTLTHATYTNAIEIEKLKPLISEEKLNEFESYRNSLLDLIEKLKN